ncbi:MAG: cation:proton antiporter, partial [bacterium]|nr:cation:proton antiporter [bacterium]
MSNSLLNDLLAILILSAVMIYICQRFRVPSVIGLLLAGMVSGPHGLRLIHQPQSVQVLSEVGIVALLFTIGMEFSLRGLWRVKRAVFLGGTLQVLLTSAVAAFFALKLGRPAGEALFIGFLISLSSTAIVMKIIQERGEMYSPHGRVILSVLIFQDLAVVPMMLAIPWLAGEAAGPGASPLLLVVKSTGMILLVFAATRWLVPEILFRVAGARSKELFLLSITAICIGMAWLTHSMGLSLALGAFLAGLIISESEYSHHALGNIIPFRDIFSSFFFISVGMLIDPGLFLHRPGLVILAAAGIFLLKFLISGLAGLALRLPLRTALLVGFGLSQVGEFSFIMSKAGIEHGLISGDIYQMFLAVSILTMAAAPFVIALAPRLA